MNNIEMLVAAWCRVGWPLLLVFTVAVLVVATLRKPCRRAFGAERAFLLWLLPPLAMLAVLLPHTSARMGTLPPIVVAITSLGRVAPSVVGTSAQGDWRIWIALLWLTGVSVNLMLAVHAQSRYSARLRGAVRYDAASPWPILRVADPHTGPALVGAWRPCIVVPADFDDRYGDDERLLILAHETMHARRGDGFWCLLAQFATALFWFHPMAWWALPAIRRDQELACDAAVLRENRGKRRTYANAMLRTQSATLTLPVGCAWSPRHPLTERVAMLKQVQPGRVRRASGAVVAGIVVLLGVGVVYAATAPASTSNVHADRYTLKMELAVDGKPPRLHATTCLGPGKHYAVTEGGIGKLPPWRGKFWVTDAPGGFLEVHAVMKGGPMTGPSSPIVRTRPGQTATIVVGGPAGKQNGVPVDHAIKIYLTPSVGC